MEVLRIIFAPIRYIYLQYLSDILFQISIIQSALKELVEIAQNRGYFSFKPTNVHYEENNSLARSTSELYNGESFASEINFSGGNSSTSPIVVKTFERDYVIPPLCSFVCCDIGNINTELSGKTFDFILLDPPWWNKFIRRKKAKCSGKGLVFSGKLIFSIL